MPEPVASGEPLTLTLLVTDVVDSTALRTRVGEARADQLAEAHHRALTTVVEQHHGQVVKGTGDGVMAAFSSATTALRAALDVARVMDLATAVAPPGERFAVRVGLAAGDVTGVDGDYQGLPAVEAARLAEAARPGEVLCSDLVVGWPGDGRAKSAASARSS